MPQKYMTYVSLEFSFQLFFPAKINPSFLTDSVKCLTQSSLGIAVKIRLGTRNF